MKVKVHGQRVKSNPAVLRPKDDPGRVGSLWLYHKDTTIHT